MESVYSAITTLKGLQKWWTDQTSGDAALNALIDFRFGERYHIQMKPITYEHNQRVVWECTLAEPDWIGTTVAFNLEEDEGKTRLKFYHDRWPTHGDFFAHCNLSWAKYLLSLRALLETGQGQPFKP